MTSSALSAILKNTTVKSATENNSAGDIITHYFIAIEEVSFMRKFRTIILSVAALLAAAALPAFGGGTYSATEGGEHAIELASGTAEYSDITVTKTGGQSGEDADFYGTNAAILASGGSTLTITGASTAITTDGQHANAVFAYGATVNISDAKITTSSNNSGGIMTTGGGVMKASNLTVTTSGGSSAAIRSG